MATTPCALIALFGALSLSAAAAPTLCQPAEITVFSCGAGKKVISVCASKDATSDRGYLQYRFGTPKHVELAVPADHSTPPSKSAIAGNLMFSGGGGAYLRFKTGEYEYVVYTAIGRGWGTRTAYPSSATASALVTSPAPTRRIRSSALISSPKPASAKIQASSIFPETIFWVALATPLYRPGVS